MMLFKRCPTTRIFESDPDKRISTACLASTIAAASCMCILFFLNYALTAERRALQIQDKINPNHANVSSLLRLPGIGYTKAFSIINYRQSVSARNDDNNVYNTCRDMCKIKGIGPKTSEKICAYLEFN